MSIRPSSPLLCLAALECLEPRRLLSADGPPTLIQAPFRGTGQQLLIFGTAESDTIRLSSISGSLVVSDGAGGWSQVLNAAFGRIVIRGRGGNDSISADPTITARTVIYGNSGDDTLTGGSGRTRLLGGGGDDALVGGSGRDRLEGGRGDNILQGRGGNDTLEAGSGRDRLDGGEGNDRIMGGSGAQQTLLGGGGDDSIHARGTGAILDGEAGRDTLLAMGSGDAVLAGGSGDDSFWMDGSGVQSVTDLSLTERGQGALHQVDQFEPYRFVSQGQTQVLPAVAVSADALGADLPEPVTTSSIYEYRDFSGRPLFSDAGPTATDVVQGSVGDCYFVAVLASIAQADPAVIRQSVADLGDGTFVVQFARGGDKVFIRVSGQLPVGPGNSLAYAKLGAQDSLWAAILEKAYAFFRDGSGTYASLHGGWMGESYSAFGVASTDTWAVTDGTALLRLIQDELASGNAVTWGTGFIPPGVPLVSGHAYSVDAVLTDATGTPTAIRLRNPWGFDGIGNDGNNDGYITLTAQQAFASFFGIVSTAGM